MPVRSRCCLTMEWRQLPPAPQPRPCCAQVDAAFENALLAWNPRCRSQMTCIGSRHAHPIRALKSRNHQVTMCDLDHIDFANFVTKAIIMPFRFGADKDPAVGSLRHSSRLL